ncbi:hypothetical protein CPB86DRAFT_516814 [Serendipita vermifera]|nr:hypothetical protein CPB86DRAFT_516814 [Serendipita vermifera]
MSIVPEGVELDQIGILRPKEAFPSINYTDLESKFPSARVDWLTLDDISYEIAVMMSEEPTTRTIWSCGPGIPVKAYLPMGITLANGKSVTVLPKGQTLPVARKFIFTTPKDDQQTATVRLLRGALPIGEVTLEGMIPRPRSKAAIKVTINTNGSGGMTATVEEIGTDLKLEKDVGSVIDWNEYLNERATEAYETYKKSLDKQTDMILGRDGVIGELPE